MPRIADCERDLKGLHEWKEVGDDNWSPLFWCEKCGSLGHLVDPLKRSFRKEVSLRIKALREQK